MNRFYLDTNILYFTLFETTELSNDVKAVVSDYANTLYTSTVCVMELIQLLQTRKSSNKGIDIAEIFNILRTYNISIEEVKVRHLEQLIKTPVLHSDSNDRLIIAQAASDRITLISSDSQFEKYTKHLKTFTFIHNKR